MLADLLLANLIGFLFGSLVVLMMLEILRAGDAHNGLERALERGIIQFPDARYHLAELDPAGGFHQDIITGRGPEFARIEKIQLAGILKTNANYIDHRFFSSIRLSSSCSTTACQVT